MASALETRQRTYRPSVRRRYIVRFAMSEVCDLRSFKTGQVSNLLVGEIRDALLVADLQRSSA